MASNRKEYPKLWLILGILICSIVCVKASHQAEDSGASGVSKRIDLDSIYYPDEDDYEDYDEKQDEDCSKDKLPTISHHHHIHIHTRNQPTISKPLTSTTQQPPTTTTTRPTMRIKAMGKASTKTKSPAPQTTSKSTSEQPVTNSKMFSTNRTTEFPAKVNNTNEEAEYYD